MTRAREQIRFIVVGAAAIFLIGTAGYMAFEGWTFIESLYMTVITLTTVGYGEVHPLGAGGRIFTIVLILLGVFLAAYSATVVGQVLLDGTLGRMVRRRRMRKRISELKDHCIVCGAGRTGREVIAYLQSQRIPFVVIDESQEVVDELRGHRIPIVHGNAHENEVLAEAGLLSARALISCVKADADNVFIALTVRAIRADLPIASRCEQRGTEAKLRRAGATRVVNPYSIAGRNLVASIYRPAFLDFIENTALPGGRTDFGELVVDPDAPAVGQTIGQLGIAREYKVSVLAIRPHGREVVPNPGADTVLEPLDTILALGPIDQLDRLRGILESRPVGGSDA